jgi:spermidine/putrescine transport system ATP-binding protein
MNVDRRPIVQVEGISKRFAGASRGSEVVALEDIHLDVQQGEFVPLLGPSGCGKTTLLRILAGLEVPTAGRIFIDGQDTTDVPPEKRPVNIVFQTPVLFPHRSVYENIAFGPRMAGASAGQITPRLAEVLALVRLEGFEARRVTQLSEDRASVSALARALINRPKVLLDEPLSALDLKLRKAMQLELKRIHRRLGTTFIYVTHDQEEAIVVADRIAIMNQGHIVQDGPPDDIYRRPSSVFGADFIGESNLLPATRRSCASWSGPASWTWTGLSKTARDLGASGRRTFWEVTFPLIRSSIVGGSSSSSPNPSTYSSLPS